MFQKYCSVFSVIGFCKTYTYKKVAAYICPSMRPLTDAIIEYKFHPIVGVFQPAITLFPSHICQLRLFYGCDKFWTVSQYLLLRIGLLSE